MAYWLFVVSGLDDRAESFLDKKDFIKHSKVNIWGLDFRTRNINQLSDKDECIFYVGGARNHLFIGKAIISGKFFTLDKLFREKNENNNFINNMPLAIKLSNLKYFKKPINIKDILDKMSFIEKKGNYGAYLLGGVIAIPKPDFDYIIKAGLNG